MIMRRRGFLSLFGASAAIIAADRLMPVRSPPILLYGDGVHNDSPAIKAMIDGKRVWDVIRREWLQAGNNRVYIPPGKYFMSSQVLMDKENTDLDLGGARLDASQMPDNEAVFKVMADGNSIRNAVVLGKGPLHPGLKFLQVPGDPFNHFAIVNYETKMFDPKVFEPKASTLLSFTLRNSDPLKSWKMIV